MKAANGIEPKWVRSEEDFRKYVADENRIPSIVAIELIPPPKIQKDTLKSAS